MTKPKSMYGWYRCTTEEKMMGRKVRVIGNIGNRLGQVPVGTTGEIIRKRAGLTIAFDICLHCGFQLTVSRIRPTDIALIEDA